jgi:peptidoglycan biosynthesis protein MviN/MurJ (putative lipid II flippase)
MVGIVGEGVNIVSALILRKYFGVAGLAMAFSLAAFVQVIGLRVLLVRYKMIDKSPVWAEVWKLFLGLSVSLVVGYAVKYLIGTLVPLRYVWQVFLQMSVTGIACVATYAAVMEGTRMKEWHDMRGMVSARIWRRMKPPTDVDATESQADAR